jgi:hypothetical protein
VSGLEYSYTHASKTLVISKTSGAFDPADVAKVVEAIQLKNTDDAMPAVICAVFAITELLD